jgi:hypothetical protein
MVGGGVWARLRLHRGRGNIEQVGFGSQRRPSRNRTSSCIGYRGEIPLLGGRGHGRWLFDCGVTRSSSNNSIAVRPNAITAHSINPAAYAARGAI